MEINFQIELSKSQRDMYELVHDYKYKYYTFVCSRQSGKSVLMQILCIEWLMGKNNSIAYVCRNFILAKKIYRELVKIIPKEVIKSANGSDLIIESIYGSTLTFASAEQGPSLRGQTYTHLIADEFAFFKMEQTDGTHLWNDILSPTLKARGKKCIFVSTPLGKNNELYTMYKRGFLPDFPDYASLKKTIYDDGFITEEQIEEIKKSIPEQSFLQEYLCEFLEDGISFFKGYADCFDYTNFNSTMTWIGIDLSSNGDDNTIVTVINENHQCIQHEIQGTLDMKYREIARIINNSNNLQVAYIENNGIGTPMINEVKKLVKNKSRIKEWTTTNASKEEIVSNMAVAIANKEIHFKKDDDKLYSELGTFTVSISKSRKMVFNGKNNHDDRIMSLCIAYQAKKDYDVNKIKSFASVVVI